MVIFIYFISSYKNILNLFNIIIYIKLLDDKLINRKKSFVYYNYSQKRFNLKM